MAKRGRIHERIPWARLLLGLAVVVPPLCIGGVLPWVLPLFAVLVSAFALRVCRPARTALRRPRGLWWFPVAAAVTALAWVPVGPGAVEWLAPGIAEHTSAALAGTDVAWGRVSVLPGATGMEMARLVALGLLFFAAAQMPWRYPAVATTVAATAVALVGVVHRGLGTAAIYGAYTPVETSAFGESRIGLLTSFVNPNHQSALLLLGIAAALALLLDRPAAGRGAPDPLAPEAKLALLSSLALQSVVLLLSLSRAALVLAVVIYVPVLVLLRLRRGEHDRPLRGVLLALLGGLGLAVVLGGRQAQDQLRTLLDPEAVEPKLQTMRDGLGLLELSPWLGTGRGTAGELLPLMRQDVDPVVFTHIESFPVALVVEWGPVLGGLLVLAAVGWWVLTIRAHDSRGPRLLAVGLLAVAAHNLADFNLELLGVAAPVVAIAGSIAPSVGKHPRPRQTLGWVLVAALVAVALAGATFRSGRVALRDTPSTLAPEDALRARPLDPRLHTELARRAAERQAWAEVKHHARVAATFAPSALDPWLLLGATASVTGDTEAGQRADAEAVRRLRTPIEPALVEYLVLRYEPEALAAVGPDDRSRTQALLDALLPLSPAHADAVAQAWVEANPEDPFALAYRVEAALIAETPGLALHHARLLQAHDPTASRATLLVTRALAAFSPPRDDQIRRVLEQALEHDLDDPGPVEEQLVLCLRRIGTPQALEQADEVALRLLDRPAPRAIRQRRQRLAPPRSAR